MSMRTAERPDAQDHWADSQSSDLVNGTLVIVLSFGLVCLFLMAMAH